MNRSIITATIYLLFIGSSASSQTNSSEGKIRYHSVQTEYNSAYDVNDYNYQIWYHDSCVIIEIALVFFDMGQSSNKSAATMKTIKYTFLDLRTLQCQDYSKFDTSEIPRANYLLNQPDILQWHFLGEINNSIYKRRTNNLTDTLIKANLYKRVSSDTILNPQETLRNIQYLTDKNSEKLFHLNPILDKEMKPFKVVRSDDYVNGNLVGSIYFEEIANKLTQFEKLVIQRWKLNSKQITIPIISIKQVRKLDGKQEHLKLTQ